MMVVVVVVCVDDLSNCCCVLCGWVAISILFVKNTHTPTNPAGQIGHVTSKLYEFMTVLDAVTGG